MAYAFPGEGALDYFPCRYGTSRLTFRGPRRGLDRPYVAFLGGTETYGKYVPEPFPDLVEAEIGFAAINLGCVNVGLDAYLGEPEILQMARGAEAVVLQIVGAGNLSNRYYSVHSRRNDRFLAASPLLRSLFHEVDFTDFNFTRHMLLTLHAASKDRFELLADELRATWVSRMTELLAALPARTVLLWLAGHRPAGRLPRGGLTPDPVLVDAEMLAQVRPLAGGYAEVISGPEGRLAGLDGMAFPALEAPAAAALPGPEVHRNVARILAQTLEPVLR